jgi:hypothetical protein
LTGAARSGGHRRLPRRGVSCHCGKTID